MLQAGLVRAGFETPESQVDVVLSVLRALFARATIEDDLLVVEVLRVFGQPESKVWELLQEWCAEFGRDEGEVFEHVFWAPGSDNDEEG